MKLKFTIVAILFATTSFAQSAVFSGAEATSFGTVDLATPSTATWATDRSAAPGYYSAVGAASYTNASDANNVDGYVKHYADAVNQSFSFPVGTSSDYRGLTISGAIPATSIAATAWTAGDPGNTANVAAVIEAVSKVGVWNWQDISANNAGATITVSIPDVSSFATQSNLRLVGYNGSQWIDLSGAATATGNTDNSILSGTMQSGITAIGIGSIATALPVNLINFTATAKGSIAVLDWTVGAENGLKGYQVQASADGNNFKNIGFVNATGRSGYSYNATMTAGLNYYRIGLVDLANHAAYSAVRKINSNASVDIRVYPNPVASTVNIINMAAGTHQITLFNLAGQQVINISIEGTNGLFNVTNLSSGIYIIKITNGSEIVTKKIIKK